MSLTNSLICLRSDAGQFHKYCMLANLKWLVYFLNDKTQGLVCLLYRLRTIEKVEKRTANEFTHFS